MRFIKCYKVISKNIVSFNSIEKIIKYRSENNINIKYTNFNVKTNIICYNLYKNEHKFITFNCKDILTQII